MKRNDKISIGNILVHTTTLNNLIQQIQSDLKIKKNSILPIFSINPEVIVLAQTNDPFRYILNTSYINIPDGAGVIVASNILRKPKVHRITGVSLTNELIKLCNEKSLTIGFIGGKNSASSLLYTSLKKSYPQLFLWADKGPVLEVNTSPKTIPPVSQHLFTEKTLNEINRWMNSVPTHPFTHSPSNQFTKYSIADNIVNTDMLIVCFGVPKQEYFIFSLPELLKEHKLVIQKPIVALAAGGTIDELSGIVGKSPEIVETLGLKWLYRLIKEPWRWKRQLALIKFIQMVIKEKVYNPKGS